MTEQKIEEIPVSAGQKIVATVCKSSNAGTIFFVCIKREYETPGYQVRVGTRSLKCFKDPDDAKIYIAEWGAVLEKEEAMGIFPKYKKKFRYNYVYFT